MRITAIVLAFFFTGCTASADGNGQKRGLILSWDELIALSQPQRVQYINDLTEVIITMEKAQAVYEVADNSALEELKEYVAFFRENSSLIPNAAADALTVPKVPTFDATAFAATGLGYKCLTPGLTFDQRVGTCIYLNMVKGKSTPDFGSSSCPEQAVEIKGYDRTAKVCIPQESWKLLSASRQTDLTNGKFLKADAFLKLSEGGGATLIGAGHASMNPVTGNASVGGRSEPSAPAAVLDLCGADKFACNDLSPQEKKSRIAKFRKDKTDSVCIYGGNFSKYRQTNPDSKGWKKAGTCEPIDYFPNKDGARCKGKVMCNPILFCIYGPDPKEKKDKIRTFCERKGNDATARCKAQFELHKAESGYRICDMSKDFPPRFKESWDKMAKAVEDKYNNFCLNDPNFQALFCTECKTIGEQLLAMNIKARPAQCARPNEENPKPAKPTPPEHPAK